MADKDSKYTKESAIRQITKNGGKIGNDNGIETINAPTAGLKVLGAIDYLVAKHGFYRVA